MSSKNLVEQLTPQYITEFLRSAIIQRGDEVHLLGVCTDSYVASWKLNLTDEKPTWVKGQLTFDSIQSFKDLAWPTLGYRNLENVVMGNVATFATTTRSVFRGLREENIVYSHLPIYDSMYIGAFRDKPCADPLYRIKQLFRPTWYSYKEGMNKIKDGSICGFAMNEDVAIGVSIDQGQDRFCDVFFRNRVVGQVSEEGEIMIANKVIKKNNLKKLYSSLEA